MIHVVVAAIITIIRHRYRTDRDPPVQTAHVRCLVHIPRIPIHTLIVCVTKILTLRPYPVLSHEKVTPDLAFERRFWDPKMISHRPTVLIEVVRVRHPIFGVLYQGQSALMTHI